MDVAVPLAYSSLVPEHLPWVATFIQTHLCLIWGGDLKADLLLLRRESELGKKKKSPVLSFPFPKQRNTPGQSSNSPPPSPREQRLALYKQMPQRVEIFLLPQTVDRSPVKA